MYALIDINIYNYFYYILNTCLEVNCILVRNIDRFSTNAYAYISLYFTKAATSRAFVIFEQNCL
jgi:hypothetical protein